ncbi:MAG: hypothetical protein OXI56_11615 [bacterium]|nr:hypothetical protein [bacterium]
MANPNFNIVLVGESFPINAVDVEDFDFMGEQVQEILRIPIALEAQAGDFRLSANPQRFQIAASNVTQLSQELHIVKYNAKIFLDYVGRRTVTAVGHNFQFSLPIKDDGAPFSSLVNYNAINLLMDTPFLVQVAIDVSFRSSDGTPIKLRTFPPDGNEMLLDLNYHFDIGKTKQFTNAEDAIDTIDNSFDKANDLVRRFAEHLE